MAIQREQRFFLTPCVVLGHQSRLWICCRWASYIYAETYRELFVNKDPYKQSFVQKDPTFIIRMYIISVMRETLPIFCPNSRCCAKMPHILSTTIKTALGSDRGLRRGNHLLLTNKSGFRTFIHYLEARWKACSKEITNNSSNSFIEFDNNSEMNLT